MHFHPSHLLRLRVYSRYDYPVNTHPSSGPSIMYPHYAQKTDTIYFLYYTSSKLYNIYLLDIKHIIHFLLRFTKKKFGLVRY